MIDLKAIQTECKLLSSPTIKIKTDVVLKLLRIIEVQGEALEWYTDQTALDYPEEWNCSKMGRSPTIDEYETIDLGGKARTAIEQVSKILTEQDAEIK